MKLDREERKALGVMLLGVLTIGMIFISPIIALFLAVLTGGIATV